MIYYGFFDAAFDETAGTYDRTYNSGDFTGYFEKFIGSGVCVYNNPDSFKVSISGTNTIVTSGYLFIRGYWLKNDSDYTISFTGVGDGVYAVYAKLNLGARLIELGQMAKAESYSDTLILAYVTITSGVLSVQDTRYNADICGVIDAVGSLSTKIEYAINYIDTGIESKLQQIEQDLQNQSDIINSKLDEANSLIAKIAPPPIGTVKFSASSTIEDGWLKCDGSFVSESEYPELVAALGKLIPSGDKFKLISNGEIGTGITNGVLYDSRMWVYSWSTQKLYGVDVEGEQPIKEIAITCDDTYFPNLQNPNTGNPLALSIVSDFEGGYKMFLCQIIGDVTVSTTPYTDKSKVLFFVGDMSSDSNNIALTRPFAEIDAITSKEIINTSAIPYVVSRLENGEVKYYAFSSKKEDSEDNVRYVELGFSLRWGKSNLENAEIIANSVSYDTNVEKNQNSFSYYGYSRKNQDELVMLVDYDAGVTNLYAGIVSFNDRIFNTPTFKHNLGFPSLPSIKINLPIAGQNKTLISVVLTEESLFYVTSGGEFLKSTLGDISLPSGAKVFKDGACYLWGKDMFFIFVGTGIIFSRTLETGSFGYLDTTSVMGQITQGGYIDYSQDEGTLYIMGQDTTNKVKVAKIVLNTLYDYANDGAWLPLIASDGVPAYIKAIGEPPEPEPIQVTFSEIILSPKSDIGLPNFSSIFTILVDGNPMPIGSEITFLQFVNVKMTALQDYTNSNEKPLEFAVSFSQGGLEFPIIGRVIAVGEKVVKGEVIEVQFDMQSAYNYLNAGSNPVYYITEVLQNN